jgi:hypothetical protein
LLHDSFDDVVKCDVVGDIPDGDEHAEYKEEAGDVFVFHVCVTLRTYLAMYSSVLALISNCLEMCLPRFKLLTVTVQQYSDLASRVSVSEVLSHTQMR